MHKPKEQEESSVTTAILQWCHFNFTGLARQARAVFQEPPGRDLRARKRGATREERLPHYKTRTIVEIIATVWGDF